MKNQDNQINLSNNPKERRHNRKTGFYYSFFTVVLIFCLIQAGYGGILNISKIISYKAKAITLEKLLKQAKARNKDLKAEKRMITSDNSLEGIARNNLKMAGQDEVLVIINKKVEKPKKKKRFWKYKKFKFNLKKQNKNRGKVEKPYVPEEVTEE